MTDFDSARSSQMAVIHGANVLLEVLGRRPECDATSPTYSSGTAPRTAVPGTVWMAVSSIQESLPLFVSFWIIGPSAGAVLSYLFFALVPFVG